MFIFNDEIIHSSGHDQDSTVIHKIFKLDKF